MAKKYRVEHSIVGPFTEGQHITEEEFTSATGTDRGRFQELVRGGAFREVSANEAAAGDGDHSNRDASFVEDTAADEMRGRIAELESLRGVVDTKDKEIQRLQAELAKAVQTRDKAHESGTTGAGGTTTTAPSSVTGDPGNAARNKGGK